MATTEIVTIIETPDGETETSVIPTEVITIVETAADGTETTVIEEIFQVPVDDASDAGGIFADAGTSDGWSADDFSTHDDVTSADNFSHADGSGFAPTIGTLDETNAFAANTGDVFAASGSVDAGGNNDAANADLAAHASAATDAQEAADAFVASGDYAAAEQARETAESEAAWAGDPSMLAGSDASDLDNSAYQRPTAE